jgi:hypothetical protein
MSELEHDGRRRGRAQRGARRREEAVLIAHDWGAAGRRPTISANDFEFIDRIWGDWSPGYDASEDLPLVKDCIREPAYLQTALGYYWGQFDPTRFGSEEWAAEQKAAWGYSLRQPTLYLHGTTDGCHGMSREQVARVPGYRGPGSPRPS